MKKNVLTFGLIAGCIVTAMMIYSTVALYTDDNFRASELLGYATMIAAFSFIFIGIRNYRNKYNQGFISFGKAFKVGFLITLVASTMYVVVWLIDYYVFVPDFMDRYVQCMIKDAQAEGASAAVINEKKENMEMMKNLYKNPVMVVLLTYMEILPVGLIISVISALILKRKPKPGDTAFVS